MSHDKLIAEKLGLKLLELAEYITLHKESVSEPFCVKRNKRLFQINNLIACKLRTQGANKISLQDMNFLNDYMRASRSDEHKAIRYDIELLYAQLSELDELMSKCAA